MMAEEVALRRASPQGLNVRESRGLGGAGLQGPAALGNLGVSVPEVPGSWLPPSFPPSWKTTSAVLGEVSFSLSQFV